MLTLPIAVSFAAAVLATSFLSGIFGMAGGMILMGLLLAMLPVAPAMLLHGVTQLAANGWRAWLWQAHVQWQVVQRFGAAALITAVLIALLPFTTNKAIALVVLGLTPFLVLLLPGDWRPDATRRTHAWICGLTCTTLQLVAGVAGPTLDAFFVHSGMDRKQVVATKAAIQTLSHILKILYFGSLIALDGGSVDAAVVILAIGFAVLGTNLSRVVLDAMSDAQFNRWTKWIVYATALIYLVQGVWLMMAPPN